jgi:hypothetical protein
MAYDADQRDRDRERRNDREPWSPAKQLSADLATVYRDHWGELDDDREGRGLFAILLHTLAHRPAFETLAAEARREFAPWLSNDNFERMSAEARKIKRKWKPDTLAQRIGLTYADQQRLGVYRFIGAVDVPKKERDRLSADRRNANKRALHKAAGGMSRPEYEAPAKARRARAKALGISEDALRKRKQRAAAKECPKSGTDTKRNTTIGDTLGTPPKQAAPPIRGQDQKWCERTSAPDLQRRGKETNLKERHDIVWTELPWLSMTENQKARAIVAMNAEHEARRPAYEARKAQERAEALSMLAKALLDHMRELDSYPRLTMAERDAMQREADARL